MFNYEKRVGAGVYGKCYAVKEKSTKKEYVIKRNITDWNISFIATIRELDILSRIPDHPNIIKLINVYFDAPFKITPSMKLQNSRDDIFFQFYKANLDLYDYIRFTKVPDFKKIKRFCVHSLLGLEFIHQNKILHRDIKPANLLIFEDSIDLSGQKGVLQIADFGLSKPYTTQGYDTPGMVTSWYRAPEILYGKKYDYKIDVWSMACCFFEMITKKPLFRNVNESEEIAQKILFQMRRKPTDSELSILENPEESPDEFDSWMTQLDFKKDIFENFKENFANHEDFFDLMDGMMEIIPEKRLTSTECLNHRFFDDFRELINSTRKKYSPEEMEYRIGVHYCQEREWVFEIVSELFNNRQEPSKKKWYSPRILFQGIDIFDRYLAGYYSIEQNPPHTESETRLYFFICLYISVKYFSSIHHPIQFSDLVDFEYSDSEVKEFEEALIRDCLQYKIYRDTIYEYCDSVNHRLNPTEIRDLLILLFEEDSLTNMTPKQLYEKFKEMKGNQKW